MKVEDDNFYIWFGYNLAKPKKIIKKCLELKTYMG